MTSVGVDPVITKSYLKNSMQDECNTPVSPDEQRYPKHFGDVAKNVKGFEFCGRKDHYGRSFREWFGLSLPWWRYLTEE